MGNGKGRQQRNTKALRQGIYVTKCSSAAASSLAASHSVTTWAQGGGGKGREALSGEAERNSIGTREGFTRETVGNLFTQV